MEDNFTPEFFAGNRRKLLEKVGREAPVVVAANGLLQRNGDCTFKFRQDSSFWYLTGIEEPDITLVMDADDAYLILPERDIVRAAFDGTVTAEHLSERSGIDVVLGTDAGWKRLSSRLKKTKRVMTPEALPEYVERYGLYTNPARSALASRLKKTHKTIDFVDIRESMMQLRAIKQPVEVEAIEQAVTVTIDTMEYITAPERWTQYRHEYEIEADMTRGFRRRGCDHSFSPIIASGGRTCQLHYVANNGPMAKDGLVVLDVGAEAGLYAADITRTYAFGKVNKRQRQVYDAVCAVQDFAFGLLKPGTVMVDYENAVERLMGEKLIELKLIKKNDNNHATVRKYYPHATSHFMGLDVHDTGDYREPLRLGMVLTCEPGIYIPEEGIGVRIEDDVLITKDGNRVMTSRLPRSLT